MDFLKVQFLFFDKKEREKLIAGFRCCVSGVSALVDVNEPCRDLQCNRFVVTFLPFCFFCLLVTAPRFVVTVVAASVLSNVDQTLPTSAATNFAHVYL